jgi:hypothetical protein
VVNGVRMMTLMGVIFIVCKRIMMNFTLPLVTRMIDSSWMEMYEL